MRQQYRLEDKEAIDPNVACEALLQCPTVFLRAKQPGAFGLQYDGEVDGFMTKSEPNVASAGHRR